MERVHQLQQLITSERYESWIGRTVRAMVDRATDESGWAQARLDAQADDIDGVTWVVTDARPGTLLEIRLDEVVDDYDFRGTVLGVLDEAPTTTIHLSSRSLPIAAGTIGSFGR